MVIESRFMGGDIVFYLENNVVKKGVVSKLAIEYDWSESKGWIKISERYWLERSGMMMYAGTDLFPTKEELLKSL